MITHIEIEGFKSLKKVSLDLGGLNTFIGTNASGKSNFFEALRVLQGIGYGFGVNEIFNGKPRGSTRDVWEGIRGGGGWASFRHPSTETSTEIVSFKVQLNDPDECRQPFTYSITIGMADTRVQDESLYEGGLKVFARSERAGWSDADDDAPQLAQMALWKAWPEHDLKRIETCCRLLTNSQVLDPVASNLRGYSEMRLAKRMGDHGENFAGLVRSILDHDDRRVPYTTWLKELTPNELDEVALMSGALSEPLFAVKKGNQMFPAPILSDGTLRFAALAAAFFQPDMPDTILIEEIETGLHPTRLRLLLELLKSQSAIGRPQVMATSHSPQVLAWLTEEDYQTTFLCRKDDETGATTITPLSEVPGFVDLARKQSAADLFAEGWLEGAL